MEYLVVWLLVGYDPDRWPETHWYGRTDYYVTSMSPANCKVAMHQWNEQSREQDYHGRTIRQYACLAPDGTWPFGAIETKKVVDEINRANQ